MRRRYLEGGVGYAEVKEELAGLLRDTFEAPRRRFTELMDDRARIDAVLAEGARKARATARGVLTRVRKAVGLEA
jgi:tryptophanyl-tRNA synthetase